MLTIKVLADIIRIAGYADKLKEKVLEWNERNRTMVKDGRNLERYNALRSIFENNLDIQLLLRYYSRRAKGDDSYFYHYLVDGNDVLTNSLTRPCWNKRIVPLTLDDPYYSLVKEKTNPRLPGLDRASKLISVVGNQNLRLEDRNIYRMTDFSYNEREFHSKFAVIDFFAYRFTIGLVDTELYEAVIDAGRSLDDVLADPSSHLPIREMILPSRKALLNPASRLCAGGVFVLFAMARPSPDNDYCFITHTRSKEVSDNQSSISVIPRAYHQHMVNRRIETNILRTVFREIYEELFKGEEVEGSSKHANPEYYFRNCEALAWMKKNLHNISMDMVSYGFNGLTGNFEYGILFAIHDPYFYEHYFDDIELNWEGEEAELHYSSEEKNISSLLRDKNWATETIPPIIESLRRLKEIQPKKVSLPDIQAVSN